jgi:hypothetical protein
MEQIFYCSHSKITSAMRICHAFHAYFFYLKEEYFRREEKTLKYSFSGVISIDPKRFLDSGVEAVECPACDVPLSTFASERESSPPRSKALFEPMVGIRLVVEGFHFLVSAVSVQLDGFNEGAVRFQVQNRNSRFPCVALQSL